MSLAVVGPFAVVIEWRLLSLEPAIVASLVAVGPFAVI